MRVKKSNKLSCSSIKDIVLNNRQTDKCGGAFIEWTLSKAQSIETTIFKNATFEVERIVKHMSDSLKVIV